LKKMGFPPGDHGPAYTKDVPKLAKEFASQLLAEEGLIPGLVVVPASASKQYKPYLDALLEAKADLPVLNGAFAKPDGFQAGDTGRTYEQVLAATEFDAGKLPDGVAALTRVWIIDDIYNTGNTAGAMATRLKEHLPALEQIVVACPLYVPLEKKTGT